MVTPTMCVKINGVNNKLLIALSNAKNLNLIKMKLTPHQLNRVLSLGQEKIRQHSQFRQGQAFYIALAELFPDVAQSITETEIDPFYDDIKRSKCIEEISEK